MRSSLVALLVLPLVTIQTGDATAKSQVTTDVSGGTVETHIKTQVNGNVTELESTQPGRIDVVATSGGMTVATTPENLSITPTITTGASASQFLVPEVKFLQGVKTFLSNTLHSIFQKIFSFFFVRS